MKLLLCSLEHKSRRLKRLLCYDENRWSSFFCNYGVELDVGVSLELRTWIRCSRFSLGK